MGSTDDGQHSRWATLAMGSTKNYGQHQRWAALMMSSTDNDGTTLNMCNTDDEWHWQRWGNTDNDGQH